MTATWHDLAAAIGVAPSLPGARCRGKPHLFDAAGTHEPAATVAQRHQQALGLCDRCPALEPCRQWLDGLPKGRRPEGVVAGIVNHPKPVGRPKRSA